MLQKPKKWKVVTLFSLFCGTLPSLVVHDGQTGLIVVLLQPLDRQPARVRHLDLARLQPVEIVRLLPSRLASPAVAGQFS